METQRITPVKLILWVITIVVGISLIVNIGYSTYIIVRQRDLVTTREATLKRLEKEQIELKNELSHTLKSVFIEEEARNKLGFAKNGETVILLPDQATKSGILTTQGDRAQKSTLQEWFDLFVYGG